MLKFETNKIFKQNCFVVCILIIFSACSSKYSLQKRRYVKGFYFSNHHNKSTQSLKKNSKEVALTFIKPDSPTNTKAETNIPTNTNNLTEVIAKVDTFKVTQLAYEHITVSSKKSNLTNHQIVKFNVPDIPFYRSNRSPSKPGESTIFGTALGIYAIIALLFFTEGPHAVSFLFFSMATTVLLLIAFVSFLILCLMRYGIIFKN